MNLQELQKQIRNNNLENLYIFIGEEIAIQKIYINKISEITNLPIEYSESYKQILNKISSNNLFGTKKIYVVLDDTDILKQEDVLTALDTNGNIIIFKYSSLDSRSKFYKTYADKFIEFNKLSDDILTMYIQKEMPSFKNPNCKKLIDMCGNNYNQILLELDKIKNYIVPIEDQPGNVYGINYRFEMLEKQGAFYKEVADIIFDFIDSVITRDIKNVHILQKQLKQSDESTLKIIGLLYNSFKIILLIQSCKSGDICKTTGLQNNQVYYNKEKTGYYKIGELVNALRLLQKVESGIKTGKIEEQYALDYLLVNIL